MKSGDERFIKNRLNWILSKREFDGWIHIATSNLAIQALIFSREIDIDQIDPSIQWLLGKQIEGSWREVTSTSLSLISLKMYLDYQLEHEFSYEWYTVLKTCAHKKSLLQELTSFAKE